MEPRIFNLDQIKEALREINPLEAVEKGFVAYSQGKAIIPPVGELLFNSPPGDAHIKYGYIKGDEFYVIKVASGFYENANTGIPSTSGLMLLFKQKTGECAGILLDQGYLTNIRTAAAGAVAAKYLAPKQVDCIGVLGAGIQGRLQVEFLYPIVKCRNIMIWGIDEAECLCYQRDMEAQGYRVALAKEQSEIARQCNLIITATPSKSPLLTVDQIRKGTHITAMGSDTPEKQELDARILRDADLVVADSIEQCRTRGEIFKGISAGILAEGKPLELGLVISGKAPRRTSENQITVADLTGVAIQDIQISVALFKTLSAKKK